MFNVFIIYNFLISRPPIYFTAIAICIILWKCYNFPNALNCIWWSGTLIPVIADFTLQVVIYLGLLNSPWMLHFRKKHNAVFLVVKDYDVLYAYVLLRPTICTILHIYTYILIHIIILISTAKLIIIFIIVVVASVACRWCHESDSIKDQWKMLASNLRVFLNIQGKIGQSDVIIIVSWRHNEAMTKPWAGVSFNRFICALGQVETFRNIL